MKIKWIALALMLAAPGLAYADTTVTSHHVVPQASAAAEATHVVSAIPAVLYGASVSVGATAGYFMILNLAADAGGSGAAVLPVKCQEVAAHSTVTFTPDTNTAWHFDKGIILVFSTTGCFTETTGSATAFFSWQMEQ